MGVEHGISTVGLTKYYGSNLGVEDVTFDVARGEVLGFLGPNGSGKTTVMRMLIGLLGITRGSATVLGMDVAANGPRVRARIGYLPGTMQLPRNMTVRRYLSFVAGMRGLELDREAGDLCGRFGLSMDADLAGLSKGTKQKVGVVQAFMHSPDVLILDEPTSGLDPIVQREFESLLAEHRDRGAAVLLSSHVMHEVEVLATRVAIVQRGHMLLVESVGSLKSRTTRSLRFEFDREMPATTFMGVDGVQEVLVDHKWLECTVVGSENPIMAEAARLGALTVVSHEPSLEDIFLTSTGNGDA